MITTWILTVLTLTLGFITGYLIAVKEENPQRFKRLTRLKKPRVGTVSRPTAEQLRKKGTQEEQTEKAMEDLLDKTL